MTTVFKEELKMEVLENVIPSYVNDVILSSNLDEGFDYKNSKLILVGKFDDKVVGLVSYGEMNIDKIYPRFLHIIITPEFKRTRIAYNMLKESENILKQRGNDIILCHIYWDLPNREMKKKYALKFGYVEYSKDSLGEHFYKKI